GTINTGSGSLVVSSPTTMSLSGGTTTVSSGRTVDAARLLVSGGNNIIESNARVNVGTGGFVMTNTEGANPTLFLTSNAVTPAVLSMGAGAGLSFTGTAGMASIGGNEIAGQLDLAASTHTFDISEGTSPVDMTITANIVN